jgi:hypothetical protein
MAKAKDLFAVAPSQTGLAPSLRAGGGEREYEPTPFDSTIENAAAGDTFDVKVQPDAVIDGKDRTQADEAVSLLNKSARHFGRYLRIRYLIEDRTPVKRGSEGIAIVQFQVSDEPARQVRFTADEIREWATENGLAVEGGGKTGKGIPAETRAAFWAAVAEMDAQGEASEEAATA